MKALVLLAPRTLVLQERSVPEAAPTEVVIDVAVAAICHTDLVELEGGFLDINYPTVLGHEFSGIVAACGEAVTHIAPGDRVSSMGYSPCGTCQFCRRGLHNGCRNVRWIPGNLEGAFQEYVCVPANMVWKLDDRLSLEEGALAEPAANGYAAVARARINPGDHVVIIGPGPIGLLAVQCARLKSPASLTVAGTRADRLALARRFGATHVVNVRETDPYAAILAASGGLGGDVVILCAGTEDAWELSGRVVSKCGRVVVEAVAPSYDTRWPVSVMDFTSRAISYLGVSGYTAGEYQAAVDLLSLKVMDAKPLVTHRFRLEDYEQAFETSKTRAGGAIKVLFEI